jgi:hypothetical protein
MLSTWVKKKNKVYLKKNIADNTYEYNIFDSISFLKNIKNQTKPNHGRVHWFKHFIDKNRSKPVQLPLLISIDNINIVRLNTFTRVQTWNLTVVHIYYHFTLMWTLFFCNSSWYRSYIYFLPIKNQYPLDSICLSLYFCHYFLFFP